MIYLNVFADKKTETAIEQALSTMVQNLRKAQLASNQPDFEMSTPQEAEFFE